MMDKVIWDIWNVVLTLLFAVSAWVVNEKFKEIGRLSILLNRTREEIARDHITRKEVKEDMEVLFKRLDERLDKMDAKLDAVIKETNHAQCK